MIRAVAIQLLVQYKTTLCSEKTKHNYGSIEANC